MNVCQICGVPADAGYFDAAEIKPAPQNPGDEQEVARFELHPQYCGVLLHFAQHVEPKAPPTTAIVETPGYEWIILCNNQPRAPYLATSVIRNAWGFNAFPVHLRLEEGCTIRFIVRNVSPTSSQVLNRVGGRLQGRYWYNTIYGGVSAQH
jgi:hypothetical protein